MAGRWQFRQQAALAVAMHRHVRPAVAAELRSWEQQAERIPDADLRRQALTSLRHKRFHCEGGAVYAAAPGRVSLSLVRAICSLQTLVDYLDNLADRTGTQTAVNLTQLHLAVDDALLPGAPTRDYYRYHSAHDDGGYLAALVRACQAQLAHLCGYSGEAARAARLLGAAYARLQVCKHLPVPERERALCQWLHSLHDSYPGLRWWEVAAACGSTLGIFALWRAAAAGNVPPAQVTQLVQSYFPWIGGLHILLDYLIDLEEDRRGGDLNFVAYYRNLPEAIGRLGLIFRYARQAAAALPEPSLHRLVVAGLPGIYLADPKVRLQRLGGAAAGLLLNTGPLGLASFLYYSLPPRRAPQPG